MPASPDSALNALANSLPEYREAADLIIGEGVRLNVAGSNRGTMVPVIAPGLVEGMRIITARDLYTAEDAASLRHPEADKLHRYDRIQLSEEDGAALGLYSGDEVDISADGTTITAKATVTERVPAGHVFASSLLQGGAVTRLYANGHVPSVTIRKTGAAISIEEGRPHANSTSAEEPALPQMSPVALMDAPEAK